MNREKRNRWNPALTVIVAFGLISMFGDMVYEGARGVNSQYLNLLGITAAKVGLVFGIGEFLGYFLRFFAGVLSDKSGKYWRFMFIGYGMLLAVPVIGLTLNWDVLIVLIFVERIGKALRNPAKDTMLSGVAGGEVGTGFAFGLQEALDQIGAFSGPLIFALVFTVTGKKTISQYQSGYLILFIPFLILMIFLIYVCRKTSRENLIPALKRGKFHRDKLTSTFWIYAAFSFFSALGFVNFSLIGYHLKAGELFSDANIAVLYSAAMFVDALVALIIGRAYDRLKAGTGRKRAGLVLLSGIPVASCALPFLVFARSPAYITAGMMVFGGIIGAHETIMRSAIADITPLNKRGTGYGVFYTCYGFALMAGASLMAWLYDRAMNQAITVFVCSAEAVALALFFRMIWAARRQL